MSLGINKMPKWLFHEFFCHVMQYGDHEKIIAE